MFLPVAPAHNRTASVSKHQHQVQHASAHNGNTAPPALSSRPATVSASAPVNNSTSASTHQPAAHQPSQSQQQLPALPSSPVTGGGGSTFVVDAAMMIENRAFDAHNNASHSMHTKPRRLLKPLFHVTTCDVVITAIECGPPNSGVMAFALSSGDVYICRAPTNEGGVGTDDDMHSRAAGEWETAPVHIGTMPAAVTQLSWATPRIASTTRAVLHLACCCPNRSVKVFTSDPSRRYTQGTRGGTAGLGDSDASTSGGWVEEAVEVDDCIAVAWSSSAPVSQQGGAAGAFTSSLVSNPSILQNELSLMCVWGKQKISSCIRRDDGYGVWVEAFVFSAAAPPQVQPQGTQGFGDAVGSAPRGGIGAPVPAAAKRAQSSSKEVLCLAVSCDPCTGLPAGNMLAVGDIDGGVRVLEAPPHTGGARQGAPSNSGVNGVAAASGPAVLLQLNHHALASVPSSSAAAGPALSSSVLCGGVRHVAWAPAQGRSFTPLAYIAGMELVVLLVANSLCNLLDSTIPIGTVLGYRRVYLDEEVFKTTWNPSGTRITTSHADGTVRVHCLATTYRDTRRARGASIVASSSGVPVGRQHDGAATYDNAVSPPIVEKYNVVVEEMSRSIAPYAADPLASLRDSA